jgi:hypothetical protein
MAPKTLANSIFYRTCVECERVFDMTNTVDSNEWSFGHDCEA